MHISLVILFSGLIYILGFGALSYVRRQGLSLRFATEGVIITLLATGLAYAVTPVHPLLFVVVIYLVTMRVRLLVDLANWFTARRRYDSSHSLLQLALRIWPDSVSRQIALINLGVVQLRQQDAETAYSTLKEALAGSEKERAGARYLAAGYYNLGLACHRTGREAEAIRYFNDAIDALPASIYAHAASRALKERSGKPK